MYKQYKYITVDAYIYKYEWKKLCKSINRILKLCKSINRILLLDGILSQYCYLLVSQFFFINNKFKLEAQWAEPVSLTFHSALRKLNTEPSIGASHQISVHFGKAVSEKIFRNRPV